MIHGFDEAAGGAVAQEKVEAVAGGEVGGGLYGAAAAEDVGAAGTEHGHGVALADTELEHVQPPGLGFQTQGSAASDPHPQDVKAILFIAGAEGHSFPHAHQEHVHPVALKAAAHVGA